MRRTDRAITDPNEITALLQACDVCRIALQDEQGLYIVPVNYAIYQKGDERILYFHGAREGRKASALSKRCNVAFEMDTAHELMEHTLPCKYSFAYKSIIGTGVASVVSDVEEQGIAMQLLMQQLAGKTVTFTPQMLAIINVYRIRVTELTGKQHLSA